MSLSAFWNTARLAGLARNLRRMVLEYLMHDGVVGSVYMYETLSDLHRLFELLDAAEAEWKASEEDSSVIKVELKKY